MRPPPPSPRASDEAPLGQVDGCIGLSEQDASYYFTTDVRDPKTAKAAGGAPRIDLAAFSKALAPR